MIHYFTKGFKTPATGLVFVCLFVTEATEYWVHGKSDLPRPEAQCQSWRSVTYLLQGFCWDSAITVVYVIYPCHKCLVKFLADVFCTIHFGQEVGERLLFINLVFVIWRGSHHNFVVKPKDCSTSLRSRYSNKLILYLLCNEVEQSLYIILYQKRKTGQFSQYLV